MDQGSVVDLVGGRNLIAEDPALDSPFRVLKISAVTSGIFREEESKPLPLEYVPPTDHLVQPGDLLMSRANTTELVGAVAYVEQVSSNIALPDKIWRLKINDETHPMYLHALLRTPQVRSSISSLASGTGGSMKNVSKAKLAAMMIPTSTRHLQQQFADRTSTIGQRRAQAVEVAQELAAVRQSIQSRAFRGDL